MLENETTSVFDTYGKYAKVDISKCLFMFLGAFNNRTMQKQTDFTDLGMSREFYGRIASAIYVPSLSLHSVIAYANDAPLLKKYGEILRLSTAELKQHSDIIIKNIIDNWETNISGLRIVNKEINNYFLNLSIR